MEYNPSHTLSESQIVLAALIEYSRLKNCSLEEASQSLSMRFFSTKDANNRDKDLDIFFTQPFELERVFGKDDASLVNAAFGNKPELIALHSDNHYTLLALMPDGDGKIAVEYYNSQTTSDPSLSGLDSSLMNVGKDFRDKVTEYIQGRGYEVKAVDKSVDQQFENNCGICVASNAAHCAAKMPVEAPQNKKDWTSKLGVATFELIAKGKESYLRDLAVEVVSAAAGGPYMASPAQSAPPPRAKQVNPQSLGQIWGELEDHLAAAAAADIQPIAQQAAHKPIPEDKDLEEALRLSLQDSMRPDALPQTYYNESVKRLLDNTDKLLEQQRDKNNPAKNAAFLALSEGIAPQIIESIEQKFDREGFRYDQNSIGSEFHRYIRERPYLPQDQKLLNNRIINSMDSIKALELQKLEEKAREVGGEARESMVHGGAGSAPASLRSQANLARGNNQGRH